jgi:hypothetical protein
VKPLNVPPEAMLWLESSALLANRAEQIVWFESTGGRALTLVSNFPYELWLDGRFVGDGGHRCAPGEALADRWEMVAQATTIQVRLHWVDLNQTRVLYRCLFPDPFFAEVAAAGTWIAYLDHSVQFASQCSAQLPRQNILLEDSADRQSISLQSANLSSPWQVVRSPLHSARYVDVIPQPTQTQILPAQTAAEAFHPQSAKDLAIYVREQRPCPLQCDTYDLGQIALHRFEVDAGSSACVLYYSEVADFLDVASTRFRAKVGLADAIAPHLKAAAPFGTRGCRYVHVLYPASDSAASGSKPGSPTVRAWRREYPLQWRSLSLAANSQQSQTILAACRANLVACIDGGAVDTCWRERAQWTGDLRMSALALRSLTENDEVIDLALHQIAQSYDPKTALVSGVWPAMQPGDGLPIPGFHLAFCLAALEHDPTLQRDSLVRQVVQESFDAWQHSYYREGLVQGMPGWQFTDWDYGDPVALGRDQGQVLPNAVCNAWWSDWCAFMKPELAIHPTVFEQSFWMGTAYALTTAKTCASPHATAAALNASLTMHHQPDCFVYLEQAIATGVIHQRVTPYFAYFVALALQQISPQRALAFVEGFYGPIAQTYGTLYEKTNDEASLAHGWSVAIAALLVQPESKLL